MSTLKTRRPNPRQASLFIVLCVSRYCQARGKATTRFRFTVSNFKKLCGRQRLRTEFILALEEELLELGWALVQTHNYYGVVRVEAVEKWARIATKRVSDELNNFAKGNLSRQRMRDLEEEVQDYLKQWDQ